MRIRAARVSMAFALVAALAVAGVAAPHVGVRFVPRPALGTAAAQAHAAASGLPGLHGAHGHPHVPSFDAVPAPATLLAILLVVAIVVRRSRRPLRVDMSAAHARGPPALR